MQYRYVNPNSDGLGDGTTRALSGANGSFASLSAAEAAIGASVGDDWTIRCRGGLDSTAVTFDFSGSFNYKILIIGDEGEDDSGDGGDVGAVVTDGRNTGTLAFDESYYYIEHATTTALSTILLLKGADPARTGTAWVHGIEIRNLQVSLAYTVGTSLKAAISIYASLWARVINCRIRSKVTHVLTRGIERPAGYNGFDLALCNNILIGPYAFTASRTFQPRAIHITPSGTTTFYCIIENNSAYHYYIGISLGTSFSQALTYAWIRNNIMEDCTYRCYSFDTAPTQPHHVVTHNAGNASAKEAKYGDGVYYASFDGATEWLDYPHASDQNLCDVRAVDENSSIVDVGVAGYFSSGQNLTLRGDIQDNSRSAVWDLGAFEFPVQGGGRTLLLTGVGA